MAGITVFYNGQSFLYTGTQNLPKDRVPEDGILARDEAGQPVKLLTGTFTEFSSIPGHCQCIRWEAVRPIVERIPPHGQYAVWSRADQTNEAPATPGI